MTEYQVRHLELQEARGDAFASLLLLVYRMRKAQKAYFNPNTRSTEVLQRSRQLEKQVDDYIRASVPTDQTSLFP